jgi:hypothetical protein
MPNIRGASLGAGLALTVGLAAAGQATWPSTAQNAVPTRNVVTAQNAIENQECAQDAKLKHATESLSVAAVNDNDIVEQNELIEEYLSFHAQVVEEGGKLSLVPGSRLRTHAN